MSDTIVDESTVEETVDSASEVEDNSVGNEVLEMSDEDFMNASESELAGESPEMNEDESDDRANLGDGNSEDELDEVENEEDEDDNAESDESTESTEDDESTEDVQPNNDESKDDTPFDYKAAYEELMAPIKASGREVTFKSPAHARNNLQMGIDYDKKMHAFNQYKPYMKALKDKGLIGGGDGVEQFNFALELMDKNPEAIKKLLADSDLDISELQYEENFSKEKNSQYKPQNQMPSQEEIAIEEALTSIDDSPVRDRTIKVMTEEFDDRSRQIISDNPSYISALNKDMEKGIFDEVMDNVRYQRDMNMIPNGVSDMEAYITTVQLMAKAEQEVDKEFAEQTQEKPNKTTTRKKEGPSSRRRKTSMSTTKSSSTKRKQIPYDPIDMSDEEFMKIDGVSSL